MDNHMLTQKDIVNAVNMYLDSKKGIENIYTGVIIESCQDIIDIYVESAKDTKSSNCIKLWTHMIKWDCQRHKQTRSWFNSIKDAVTDICTKTKMTDCKGNDYKFYEDHKYDMFEQALKEAYKDCSKTDYMTGIVPKELPSEFEITYICAGDNWLKWIRERAENNEVFNIKELSDLVPNKKSEPNIPVKRAFGKK